MAQRPRGRRQTTLKDIAKALGVSVAMVSRALSPTLPGAGRPPRTEEIRAEAKRLGYQGNAAARRLRTKVSRIIGVVVPDIANPFFPPIIRSIADEIAAHGYLEILVSSPARGARHAEAMATLRAQDIDGLIIGSVQRNDEVLRQLVADGMAVVTINRRSEDDSVSSVTAAESDGIRMILEHLRKLGHTRVVNIAGPQSTSTGLARLEAFEQHRAALGFDPASDLVVCADQYSEAEGDRCATWALEKLRRFTAIVTANDRLAAGALSALKRRRIACPARISVTGFNDMPMVDRLDPPLTTIRVNQPEIGRRAAEILMRRIASGGSFQAEHVVLPVELVVRKSTAAPPAKRPRRAKGKADRPE